MGQPAPTQARAIPATKKGPSSHPRAYILAEWWQYSWTAQSAFSPTISTAEIWVLLSRLLMRKRLTAAPASMAYGEHSDRFRAVTPPKSSDFAESICERSPMSLGLDCQT